MKWKIATGVLSLLLIASLAVQAAGIHLFASLPFGAGATTQQAAKPNLIPVKVAIAGAGSPGSSAPEFGVALGIGAFEQQGLDVSWVSMQPTTQLLIAALQTNEVQLMTSGISPFFVAAQKDVSISYVYATQKFGGPAALFVRNALKEKVKKPEDLAQVQNLRCGTGSPGTTSYASLQFHMSKFGFQCESIANTASAAVAAGAMQAGTLDVVVMNLTWGQELERQNVGYILIDTSDPDTYKQLFGDVVLPWTGYLATTDFAKKNPEIVQKFVDAMLVADMFMRTHTPDQIASVIKRSPGIDETPDQIKQAVTSVTAFKLPNPGYVSEQDWAATLPFASKFVNLDLTGPSFAYGTFWNAQFVRDSKYFTP